MSVVAKALYTGGQLTGAAVALYTSPAFTTSIISDTSFVNVDTAAHTITVYIVRSGGVAGAANTVISARTILPGNTDLAPELQAVTLGPGDAIFAKADTGSVITCPGINGFQVGSTAV